MSEYTVSVEGEPSETGEYALFSGGNDSLVSTHYVLESSERYDVDRVVYLDTRTGIPANIAHVRDVCETFDWELVLARAPISLYEFATGEGPGDRDVYGFPGPGAHSWAFRYFKERGIQALAERFDGYPRFFTGVRRHESSRRMRTVGGRVRDRDGKWQYVNPIWDWTDERVDAYRERHDLPRNPVAERLGRSGDCYCGAFASRETELLELEAHYPAHYAFIMGIEEAVQSAIGVDRENCFWGFQGLSRQELRALLAAEDPDQLSLCATCDIPRP